MLLHRILNSFCFPKHNASMNTFRRNPQWGEKRRETLLARQTPQHVFSADPPVFQVEHLLAGQIEHPNTVQIKIPHH